MLFSQQIIHRLHRIERLNRHFHKDRVPVGHRTVPQARQLQRLQFLAVFRLLRDETGLRVYKLRQIEGIAFVVLDSADEVDRIKV